MPAARPSPLLPQVPQVPEPPPALPFLAAPREGSPSSPLPSSPGPGRVTFSLFCLRTAAGRSPRWGRASSGGRRRPPRPPGGSGHGARPPRSPQAPPSSARSPRAWPGPGCRVPPWEAPCEGLRPRREGRGAPLCSSPRLLPRLGSVPGGCRSARREEAPEREAGAAGGRREARSAGLGGRPLASMPAELQQVSGEGAGRAPGLGAGTRRGPAPPFVPGRSAEIPLLSPVGELMKREEGSYCVL